MAAASSSSSGKSSKHQQQIGIFWLDSDINQTEDNLFAQQQLYNAFNNVEIFEDENQCQQSIRSNSKQPVFLIVSGRLSRTTVPVIEALGQVTGIYIYCMNEKNHIEWAKKFPKIKGILTDLEQLISKIRNDLRALIIKQPSVEPVEETSSTSHAIAIAPQVKAKSTPSSPLDGYEKVSLTTIEEAVAPLTTLIDDVAQMAWIVKQNAANPEDGLTSDESASIALFTMEWYPREKSFFILLNETLRSEDRNRIRPWFTYLKLLFHSLSKLNNVSSIIYQGTNEPLTRNYQKNDLFTSWEIMICTAEISKLQADETFGKTGRRTMFTIQCQSGKDIRRHAFDPSTEQILLLPGRQLRVNSTLNANEDLNIIQLEELDSLYSFQ